LLKRTLSHPPAYLTSFNPKLMKLLPLAALLLAAFSSFAQQPDEVWTRFSEEINGRTRYGYQDAKGHIQVPAKFGEFGTAITFRHIIAVGEANTGATYHLLKNGRQVGRDSVYMVDYYYDCENEGKIRFKSRKSNRVGFLDSQGQVAIPAVYNSITQFHNGLALALIGARATCLSGESDTMRCEHPSWVGGRWVLLDERNKIVIDNLHEQKWKGWLDLYSLKINAAVVNTATTITFRAVNGDRYSFVDYKKEFTHWLYNVFVPAVRTGKAETLASLCFTELAFRPRKGQFDLIERAAFMQQFYGPVSQSGLRAVHRDAKNVAIFTESLDMSILTSQSFQPFLTECGDAFYEKYPAFHVVVTYNSPSGKAEDIYQNDFGFIRTEEGYRLFQVSL
jgi:hypothetical protein